MATIQERTGITLSRSQIKEDAEIIARKADLLQISGAVYVFENVGPYHAQQVRVALKDRGYSLGYGGSMRVEVYPGNPDYRRIRVR